MLNSRPCLRPDLEITPPRPGADPGVFLISDPENNSAFAVEELEWSICQSLDGQNSVEQILDGLDPNVRNQLPYDHLVSFLTQLENLGLLRSDPDGGDHDRSLLVRPGRLKRWFSWPFRALIRLLFVMPGDLLSRILEFRKNLAQPRQWKIARPDRFFYWLYRHLKWCFTRFFLVAAIPWIAVGFYLLVTRWSAFWDANGMIWQASGFLRLLLVGVFCVHIPHQIAHALTLIHFHGRVQECGVRLILNVLPTFYCEISDARWIAEKSERLWVIFAGIFFQLLAFSTGMVGWALTTPFSAANTFWMTFAATAFWGFVLNANPVIKRDMYFFLTGWLETPELRDRARDNLRAWVRWRVAPEALTVRRRFFFKSYALLSNLVGIAVVVLAALFWHRLADEYHEKAGFALIGLTLVVFQGHAAAIIGGLRKTLEEHVNKYLKWVLWAVAAVGILLVLLLPYPYEASGSVQLLAGQRIEIRSEVEGRVKEIFVEEGEWVEKGQPVVRLVDRVFERNLLASQAQLEGARAQLRLLRAGSTSEEVVKATKEVETAMAQFTWSQSRAKRFDKLFAEGVISEQEAENARQVNAIDFKELEEKRAQLDVVKRAARQESVETLEAEIRTLEVVVDGYQQDVKETLLVSPISGRVVTPRVKELTGTYVKPGQKELVIEVEDSRVIRAEVLIKQEDIAGIEIEDPVRIVVWPYPEVKFEGTIVAIAPVASTGSEMMIGDSPVIVGGSDDKVIRVTTEIANEDGLLKSDMTGYAKIATEDRPVWDVLFRPLIRWTKVEVWSWIP